MREMRTVWVWMPGMGWYVGVGNMGGYPKNMRNQSGESGQGGNSSITVEMT